MRVVGLPRVLYQADRLARTTAEPVSDEARAREGALRLWREFQALGLRGQVAAEVIGIPRSTLYRWARRRREVGIPGLEPRSRAPHRRRTPQWDPQLVTAIEDLRRQPPWFGKDKLAPLLRQRGWMVSTSTIGRILADLKRRGVLKEPPRPGVASAKRRVRRPYAVRTPRDYRPKAPGDLLHLDTTDLRPLPGVVLKHFSARDVVSRWDTLLIASRATANTATRILDALQTRCPFPVRAIQVDNGSEFQADFETACRDRGIRLFTTPPHSPKLNAFAERAHRTHKEEFYAFYDGDWTVQDITPALRDHELYYNTHRPHQSLGYHSPMEYILQCHPETPLSHMS